MTDTLTFWSRLLRQFAEALACICVIAFGIGLGGLALGAGFYYGLGGAINLVVEVRE